MNFASTPDWAWLALAVAAGLYLYRNGWLDNLLQRFNMPAPQAPLPHQQAPPPQYATPQVIMFKHVIEQPGRTIQDMPTVESPAGDSKADAPAGQPVIEKLIVKGPLKINISEGRIDVSA